MLETSYQGVNWTDTPETPLDAENLKHMDVGIAKAHAGTNIPDIDESFAVEPTEHKKVPAIYPGDTMASILSALIKVANNEEYNYSLIGEKQLKETAYPTLGDAIKGIVQRLFNLEAMAFHEVRFPWSSDDANQWLRFYRIGPVVIMNCVLITWFETGKRNSYELIPNGYRPIMIATANLSLPSSENIIGSATVNYRKEGTVEFRTSTKTTAEYYHTLAWITEDAFPHEDTSVG